MRHTWTPEGFSFSFLVLSPIQPFISELLLLFLASASPLLLAIAHNNQLDSTLPDHRLVDSLLFKNYLPSEIEKRVPVLGQTKIAHRTRVEGLAG